MLSHSLIGSKLLLNTAKPIKKSDLWNKISIKLKKNCLHQELDSLNASKKKKSVLKKLNN